MRGEPPPGSPRIQRFAVFLTAWLVRRYGWVLVATAVLSALSGLAFLRLRLDVDLVSMLPHGRPRFADYQAFVERFGSQDVAVALIRAPDRMRALRFGEAFAAELRRSAEVADVRSRVDFHAFRSALQEGALPRLLPDSARAEVAARLEPAAVDRAVQTLRGILALPGAVGSADAIAADPLGLLALLGDALVAARPDATLAPGQEYLLSPDGTRLLLLIRPAVDGYDLAADERLAAALARAERAARSAVADEAVEIAYTGAFAHAREDAALMRRDLIFYTLLAFASVLGVFLLGYRDLRILPFVSIQILAASLVAFAIGVLVEGSLNAVSLAFAAIFYGLSIDAVIHFYTRFLEERAAGRDLAAAIEETIARMLVPVTVASLTTALAFAVIGFSDLAGVAQLGFLTALGMVLNVPATVVFLPASILWLDRRFGLFATVSDLPPAWRLAALAALMERHRRVAAAVGLAIVALALLLANRARLDTDLFHLRPSGSNAAAVDAELQREFAFTDPHGAVLAVATDRSPDAREGVLRVTEAVARELERHREAGLVTSIHSPASVLPSLATQERRLRAWAELPRERAADRLQEQLEAAGFRIDGFAPALALLRSTPEPADPTLAPLPGLELLFDRYVSLRPGEVGVLTAFSPRDVDALAEVATRLTEDVAVPPGVSLQVTGRPLMEQELHRTMIVELYGFVAVVLLGSAVMVGLSERRVRTTLAILGIPAASVVVLIGVAGLLDLRFDPVNLIVLPLTIGIGVDNCLFLAERRRELGDMAEAVARAGRALSIVTATTVVGFGALAISRYPALSGLGLMASLGLGICFVATFAFMPVFLAPFGSTRASGGELAERHD
jgi:predicted RND superfamily exporter protein